MAEMIEQWKMGWLPDYPEFRDLTCDYTEVPVKLKSLGQKNSVKAMLDAVGVTKSGLKLAPSVDLRPWCSPIENQLSIGSCTAHAG